MTQSNNITDRKTLIALAIENGAREATARKYSKKQLYAWLDRNEVDYAALPAAEPPRTGTLTAQRPDAGDAAGKVRLPRGWVLVKKTARTNALDEAGKVRASFVGRGDKRFGSAHVPGIANGATARRLAKGIGAALHTVADPAARAPRAVQGVTSVIYLSPPVAEKQHAGRYTVRVSEIKDAAALLRALAAL